jgi:hypothetical protein
MGDQVTSETHESLLIGLLAADCDGATAHMMVVCGGMKWPEQVTTRHGARDRWDWGVTLDSLMVAWDRERQSDRLVSQMTPAELAELWTGDGPEQGLLRRAARRMA